MTYESVGFVNGASVFVGPEITKRFDWGVLGDVIETDIKAGTFFKEDERGEGFPIIDMGELFANDRIESCDGFNLVPVDFIKSPRLKLSYNDLLFVRVDLAQNAGKCSIVKTTETCTYSDKGLRCIIDKTKADPDYLYYFFNSTLGKSIINGIVETTAASSIRRTCLTKLPIPIPPLNKQQLIGKVLRDLDDYISSLQTENLRLEYTIKAIFQSWFVDFQPVKAFIEGTLKSSMNKEIMMCFSRTFEDSTQGEIPSGWVPKTLNDLEFTKGKVPARIFQEKGESMVSLLSISRLKGKKECFVEEENMVLSKNTDTLMVMDGASSGQVYIGDCGAVGSTFAILNNENLPSCFLYYLMSSKSSLVANNTTGTSIPHVDKDFVKMITYIEPPKQLVELFEKIAYSHLESSLTNNQLIASTSKLRDSLLLRLVSGM